MQTSLHVIGLVFATISCARPESSKAQQPPPVTSVMLASTAPTTVPGAAVLGDARGPSIEADAPLEVAQPNAISAKATSSDAGIVDAGSDGAIDWTNKSRPDLESAALAEQGRALLEAIAQNSPESGRGFYFPRDAFTPLKDVSDPDRYWRELFATYKRDIRELHNKHRDWSQVSFESLTLGTPPRWVKPGEEYNKIGYFRTFRAKLKFKLGQRSHQFDIHTIISWNNGWYITHLLPIHRGTDAKP